MKFFCTEGKNMRFWLDIWIGDTSLAVAYPDLFSTVRGKEISVFCQYTVIYGVRDWNIQFSRVIDMSLIPSFVDLICFLNTYKWTDRDAIAWRWNLVSSF